MTPTLPIFVVEGLDISVFDSVEDVQQFLEPWWVIENIGKVYDADGRLLKAHAGKIHVTLSLAEYEPSHANELEDLLQRYLKATGKSVGNNLDCKLPCLVDACRHNPGK